MKISNFIISGAVFIMLLSGCASTSSDYKIPLPTVDIKVNPTVRITTEGNSPELVSLAKVLGKKFTKNGGKVVEGAADYWIVISGIKEKRVDTPADNKHNVIFKKVKIANSNGGEEVIQSSNFSTATDAHFASVILYDVKTMTPMVNMDFPFYSSCKNDGKSKPVLKSSGRIADAFISTMNEILVFKQK